MAQNLPKTLTLETLEQRGTLPPSRFRLRGASPSAAPPPRSPVRQVVSEYSVGPLKDTGSQNLYEFRQVVSVDGQPVQSEESARRALSLGMQSQSDRIRKRMLEEFAKHGLVDVATDYGLILLLFTRRDWNNLQVGLPAGGRIGTDAALVIAWKQLSSTGGELEFHGRRSLHLSLEGRLWIRKSDGLPLRVEAWAEALDGSHRVRDQASVEYVMSSHGFLTPASVLHRHSVDGQLMTENLYRYEPFRMFAADAEIKFTEVPEPAVPGKP